MTTIDHAPTDENHLIQNDFIQQDRLAALRTEALIGTFGPNSLQEVARQSPAQFAETAAVFHPEGSTNTFRHDEVAHRPIHAPETTLEEQTAADKAHCIATIETLHRNKVSLQDTIIRNLAKSSEDEREATILRLSAIAHGPAAYQEAFKAGLRTADKVRNFSYAHARHEIGVLAAKAYIRSEES